MRPKTRFRVFIVVSWVFLSAFVAVVYLNLPEVETSTKEWNARQKRANSPLLDNGIKLKPKQTMSQPTQPISEQYSVWPINWLKLKLLRDNFKWEKVPLEKYRLDMEKCQKTETRRLIPDTRNPLCLDAKPVKDLPTASIIIPFYNEAWPNLLRLLNGIYERTPPKLVQEVLLIDDHSTESNMIEPMEKYIGGLPRARLIRLPKRVGLAHARLIGSRQAKGDVLVFLDPHIEVNKGWLEPLLKALKSDKKMIALPHTDHIDARTFTYEKVKTIVYHTINWELKYIEIPARLPKKYRPTQTQISSSISQGHALAITKKYFKDMGEFDEGLDDRGGWNLELSFKTWMCGGSIAIIPCSKVGHLHRIGLKYPKAMEKSVARNLQRIASVWMDGYEKYYFLATGRYFKTTQHERNEIKTRRLQKSSMKCKTFDWYLENLATLSVPPRDALYFGQMRNMERGYSGHVKQCMTWDVEKALFLLKPCSVHLLEQHLYFSNTNQLKFDGKCLKYHPRLNEEDQIAAVEPCRSNDPLQVWQFSSILPKSVKDMIVPADRKQPIGSLSVTLGKKKYCLELKYSTEGKAYCFFMSPCDEDEKAQFWTFRHKFHYEVMDRIQ